MKRSEIKARALALRGEGYRPFSMFDWRRTGFVSGRLALNVGMGVDRMSSKRRNPIVWECAPGAFGGCWIRFFRLEESAQ